VIFKNIEIQPMKCHVYPPRLIISYIRGDLAEMAARSVEAHIPLCSNCLSLVAQEFDHARITRNRAVLSTRLALSCQISVTGRLDALMERMLERCGLPGYVWRLLAVTPSLRRSWLVGVTFVLATATGVGRITAAMPTLGGPTVNYATWRVALPFMIIAPLLPLAGIAAAFHPRLDPAANLATAAPMSGVWLICVRSVAVVSAALIPTILVAFELPRGGWVALLVVFPALALSSAALALATVVKPLTAVIAAGTAWIAVIIAAALIAGSPVRAYWSWAQPAWFGLAAVACCLLVARHRRLDFGWRAS
jgi:hypothetical protein